MQSQKAVTGYFSSIQLAKPKGSNCLLEKEAVTAFWLCRVVGIVNDNNIHHCYLLLGYLGNIILSLSNMKAQKGHYLLLV